MTKRPHKSADMVPKNTNSPVIADGMLLEDVRGLILCADASYEHVELLRLEEGGMYAAEYLTDLPPRHLLEAKLHEAIRMAREQIAVREGAE